MLPSPTQKMLEPMRLDDLQVEENDTIDEVSESSDASDLEVVEAPVDDEEPKEP